MMQSDGWGVWCDCGRVWTMRAHCVLPRCQCYTESIVDEHLDSCEVSMRHDRERQQRMGRTPRRKAVAK